MEIKNKSKMKLTDEIEKIVRHILGRDILGLGYKIPKPIIDNAISQLKEAITKHIVEMLPKEKTNKDYGEYEDLWNYHAGGWNECLQEIKERIGG